MDHIDIDLLHLSAGLCRHGMPRITAKDLEQQRQFGAVTPVSVRPVGAGQYEILAGAETWLCAQRLGQHQVPVFVVEDIDDEQAARITQSDPDAISEAEDFAEQLKNWPGAPRPHHRAGTITGTQSRLCCPCTALAALA